MDRKSRQKINKETKDLNNNTDQIDLTDIYKTFHPPAAEYTFFPSSLGSFSRINHMLGHDASINKFKKIETYQVFFLTTMQ